MRPARLILTAVTAAALALTAGCSAAADDPSAQTSSSSAPPSTTSSSAPSTSVPDDQGTSSAADPAAAPTVLMATTGTKDDPGAFEIALTDADGQPVTAVPAGDYTIEVQDYSKIHDFHLTGDGVDETTSVPGTGATTWRVSLSEGGYRYVCDPHAGTMNGTLTVG